MRKYFITGVVILLPVALTLAVVFYIFNLLTEPFVGIFKHLFEYYELFGAGIFFLGADELQIFVSQLMILIILFMFTISLGMLARWFFINHLLGMGEQLIQSIPFISSIYNTCKDVIKTLFTSKTSAFKQVVMVRFPHPDTYTIGLITRETMDGLEAAFDKDSILVFVPTTPNPTSGFLTLFKKSDIVYLDMKVEDAFKFIVSCGVIVAPFNDKKSACDPTPIYDAPQKHEPAAVRVEI